MNSYRNSFRPGRPGDTGFQIFFQDQIDRYTEIDQFNEIEPIGLLSRNENIDIAVRGVRTTRAASKHTNGVNSVSASVLDLTEALVRPSLGVLPEAFQISKA